MVDEMSNAFKLKRGQDYGYQFRFDKLIIEGVEGYKITANAIVLDDDELILAKFLSKTLNELPEGFLYEFALFTENISLLNNYSRVADFFDTEKQFLDTIAKSRILLFDENGYKALKRLKKKFYVIVSKNRDDEKHLERVARIISRMLRDTSDNDVIIVIYSNSFLQTLIVSKRFDDNRMYLKKSRGGGR